MSGNLVLRFAGPGDLLASGHPADEGGGLPENLGLIRSRDHGRQLGVARRRSARRDYHELETAGDMILAVSVESPDIQVSRDGGRRWRPGRRRPRRSMSSSTPGRRSSWAVSTEQGTFISTDGGGSWRPRDTTFGARLTWPGEASTASIQRGRAG